MSTMTAFRLLAWQSAGEFREVTVPTPGPGEVLLKTGAVGLCSSDVLLQDSPEGLWPFEPPFTLGHEVAGTVAGLGPGVRGLAEGDEVLLSCVHSCGDCAQCVRGRENYCWLSQRFTTRGVGLDGGLAEYVVAPARETVPVRTLTPGHAAVLSDAGATSYHAVGSVLPRLRPGSTAVVIGVGGLGGFAVQYLRLLSSARIVAVDVAEHRLRFAGELGAHETLRSDDTTTERIKDLTGGTGAEAVLDFVGTDATLTTALASAATLGRIVVCGAAGGRVPVGWGAIPGGCEFVVSYGHTLADLREVTALAEQGRLRIETDEFDFARTPQAYHALRSGTLTSRAVVTMP